MNISIIYHDLVVDKIPPDYVSEIEPFDTLKELGEILTNIHVCPSTFNLVKWDNSFVDNPRSQARNQFARQMWRNKANCKATDFLVYDFDKGTTPETIIECFKQYNCIIASSTNHMVDKNDGLGVVPRFHILIKLDSPITNPALYAFIFSQIKNTLKLDCDESVKDQCRFLKQHKSILYIKEDGEDLQVAPFEYVHKKVLAGAQFKLQLPKPEVKPTTTIESYKKWKEVYVPLLWSSEGSNKFYGVYRALCYLKKCGLDYNQSTSIISKHIIVDDSELTKMWDKIK
jgi:hypothetical protein